MFKIDFIKPSEMEETKEMIKLCFEHYIRDDYSELGQNTFITFVDNLESRNNEVYVAKHQDKVVGMIEVRNHHILLWFVHPNHVSKGIGKALFEKGTKDIIENIDVNASRYTLEIYKGLGFKQTSEMKEKDGIKYFPMSLERTVNIRPESVKDFEDVYRLLVSAFKRSDEAKLVSRLRQSDEYVADLALVAEIDGKIIGYSMMTKITIGNHQGYLALAPVAVLAEHQKKGIGSLLMKASIEKASDYKGIVVLGHSEYYPKFGFEKASKYQITCPFEVPDEVYMYYRISDDDSGTVQYSPAFQL